MSHEIFVGVFNFIFLFNSSTSPGTVILSIHHFNSKYTTVWSGFVYAEMNSFSFQTMALKLDKFDR